MTSMPFRFTWISIGCFVGAALIAVSLIAGIELVPLGPFFYGWIGIHQIDDAIAAMILTVAGFVISAHVATAARKAQYEIDLQVQRLRVLKATMRTVQDIVNNHLNACQLFAIEGLPDIESGPVRATDPGDGDKTKNACGPGDRPGKATCHWYGH
jgi:hypothetical protein